MKMRHIESGRRFAMSCRGFREFVRAILECCGAEPLWRITARFKGVSFTAEGDISMDFKDTDLPGTVTFSVAPPVDAKGRPAKLDGVPSWSLDDSSNAQILSQSADGLSCDVHIGDNPSATQLRVVGDADLGAGVTEISAFAVINVIPGDAVAFGSDIQAGAIAPDPALPGNP